MLEEIAQDFAEDLVVKEDLENKVDVQLLRTYPEQLLVKYQWLIQYLISGYVKRGFLAVEDQADLAQDINAKLLDGLLARMQERYDSRSLVRTYLGVVVRSLISDHLKHRRTQKANLVETREELPEARLSEENTGPSQLLVKEEIRRLETALKLVPRIQAKTMLCLQLLVRRPVTPALVKEYHPQCPALLINRLVEELAAYKEWDDKEVWERAVLLVNDLEGGEPISADSLRRWVRRRLDWLIAVMSGDPPRARYTDESLTLLLEYYFEHRD